MRRFAPRLSADSPFRYGTRICVDKHLQQKDFGRDVLLFATPERLNKEALSLLATSNVTNKGKAYWEIYNKRACESVHLLNCNVMVNILKSLRVSPTHDTTSAALCKIISDDIQYRGLTRERFPDINEAIPLLEMIRNNLPKIHLHVYKRVLEFAASECHALSSVSNARQLFAIISSLRTNCNITSTESEVERLLLARLLARCWQMENLEIDADVLNSPSFVGVSEIVSQM